MRSSSKTSKQFAVGSKQQARTMVCLLLPAHCLLEYRYD
jgi:hypothetical protein